MFERRADQTGQGEWKELTYESAGEAAPDWFPWGAKVSRPSYIGWRSEFEEFVASIRENRPPAVTGYDGRACTEAALAAVMSHDTGKPVQLPL